MTESQRDYLCQLIENKGLYQAAKLIGCNRGTLERAIGGLPMSPGSLALIGGAISAREAAGK